MSWLSALWRKCFTGTGMVDVPSAVRPTQHTRDTELCCSTEPRKVSSLDNSLKLALLQGVIYIFSVTVQSAQELGWVSLCLLAPEGNAGHALH